MKKLFKLDSIPLATKEDAAELFTSIFTEGTLYIMPKFGRFDMEERYDQEWLHNEDIEQYAELVGDVDTEYLIELEIICKSWLCPGLTNVLFSKCGLILKELHILEERPERCSIRAYKEPYVKVTFEAVLLGASYTLKRSAS